MKIIAFILAVLVLFLSTHSMMVHNTVETTNLKTKKLCCARSWKKTTKKKEGNNSCPGTCNPFMTCSGCMYDIIQHFRFNIVTLPSLSVKNGYKQVHFISDYISAQWHPPELFNA